MLALCPLFHALLSAPSLGTCAWPATCHLQVERGRPPMESGAEALIVLSGALQLGSALAPLSTGKLLPLEKAADRTLPRLIALCTRSPLAGGASSAASDGAAQAPLIELDCRSRLRTRSPQGSRPALGIDTARLNTTRSVEARSQFSARSPSMRSSTVRSL